MHESPSLHNATLVLAFTGWMDGGDVSTGTVRHWCICCTRKPIAEIDPNRFTSTTYPARWRWRPVPAAGDDRGRADQAVDCPRIPFMCHAAANLVLFIGKEPNLRWRTFGECIFRLTGRLDVDRIVFVDRSAAPVPHTRLPRLYVTCSDPGCCRRWTSTPSAAAATRVPMPSHLSDDAGARRSAWTWISRWPRFPATCKATNPASIEAVTRRLAKLLSCILSWPPRARPARTWELEVSRSWSRTANWPTRSVKLEDAYDNELLRSTSDET